MGADSEKPLPEKIYRLMEGNADALAAIDSVVDAATRELRVFDASARSLRDRGFANPARIEVLRNLLSADRAHRLRVILHDTRAIETELPRLLDLLTRFSGQIQIHRTVGQAVDARDPMVIADKSHFWRRLHIDHPRSVVNLNDDAASLPIIDRYEQIWEQSELAVSGGTVGL